jgi:hypothetical protein
MRFVPAWDTCGGGRVVDEGRVHVGRACSGRQVVEQVRTRRSISLVPTWAQISTRKRTRNVRVTPVAARIVESGARTNEPADTRGVVDRTNGPIELPVRESISPKYTAAIARTELIAALTASGWTKSIAVRAVDEARAHVGTDARFEDLLRESFRRCPKA